MSLEEKCGLILDHVSKGRIVVVEGGLEPIEVATLITNTMELVGVDVESEFRGVEVLSPDFPVKPPSIGRRSFFRRSNQWNGNLPTIVTPANICMKVSVS